ncbi:tubulin beta chain-related [Anaeramoeba flamelloides]|uniref:Tubulin delta chain n=1 Tax=Anaeramoeba flamelloides TaxID=1746091 RepID=A0AAV7YFJ9_9EUKA|nr:tubulin beta chain-related [Anaeramoeba flamelloides]
MSEILTLHVGGCGYSLANNFWSNLCREHKIDHEGRYYGIYDAELECISSYFHETLQEKFYPHSILVGGNLHLEETNEKQRLEDLFLPKKTITSEISNGNIWATGFLHDNDGLLKRTQKSIRKELELFENFQGFQIFHNNSSGTGGGMCSRLILWLRETFPKKNITTFSVFASPSEPDNIKYPYNTIFSLSYNLDLVNNHFCFDNEVLWDVAHSKYKIRYPKYNDLNRILCYTISDITAPFRFLNNESKKMTLETFTQSLITDPKLNSLLTFASSAKLQMKKVTSPIKNTTLFNNIFEDGPSVSCDLTKGNFINAMSIIRGNIDCTNFEEKLLEKFDQIKYPYKTQIKNSLKIERFQITRQKNKPSCLIATNHTSIINSYNKISTFFSRLLYRRAFTHYYTDEGMELDDFDESLELVKEYSNNYSIYNEILNQQKL